MSYILEALKKSEQERNPTKVPDLATHHHHIAVQAKPKFHYWIMAIALLSINALFVFYFMTQKSQSIEPIQISTPSPIAEITTDAKDEISIATSEPATEISLASEPPAKEIITELPVVTNSFNNTAKQQQPVLSKTLNPLDRDSIPDISELSFSLQQQIPDMDFSTHIYVSDGGSFIIINGKNLSDGMNVTAGLRILEITSDGVILQFKGRRFFLTSMTNWQQN